MEKKYPVVLELEPFNYSTVPHGQFVIDKFTLTYAEQFKLHYEDNYTATFTSDIATSESSVQYELDGVLLDFTHNICTISHQGQSEIFLISNSKIGIVSTIAPVNIQYDVYSYKIFIYDTYVGEIAYTNDKISYLTIASYSINLAYKSLDFAYIYQFIDKSKTTSFPLFSYDQNKITLYYNYPQYFTEYYEPTLNISFYKDYISMQIEHAIAGFPSLSNDFIIYNDRITLTILTAEDNYLKLDYQQQGNLYVLLGINKLSHGLNITLIQELEQRDNFSIPSDINHLSQYYVNYYLNLLAML